MRQGEWGGGGGRKNRQRTCRVDERVGDGLAAVLEVVAVVLLPGVPVGRERHAAAHQAHQLRVGRRKERPPPLLLLLLLLRVGTMHDFSNYPDLLLHAWMHAGSEGACRAPGRLQGRRSPARRRARRKR